MPGKTKNTLEILPIGSFRAGMTQSDFYVNRLKNHLLGYHTLIEKPHKHDFYAIIHFTSGRGTHTIDFNEYEVKSGSLFMMAPGQVHSWDLSGDADGFIFFHTRDFYNPLAIHRDTESRSFFTFTGSPPAIELPKKNSASVAQLMTRLLSEYEGNAFAREEYMRDIMELVYIEIARAMTGLLKHADLSPYYLKYLRFENLLEEKYRTEKSPSAYAAQLNMSVKHLNRIVQSIRGKPTVELILDRVILEAQRLLVHADKNFSEVARELGYDDYSYFSHIFKKKTGKSPSEFVRGI
jgi:AraC family transcriptional regulator, transcriptional activator of pobA